MLAAKDVRSLQVGLAEVEPLVSEVEVQKIKAKHPYSPETVVREIESLVTLRIEERKRAKL
ncbi:MAG: hypothetical protein WC650_06130 [Candidatus Doudnabacteria bacterium]